MGSALFGYFLLEILWRGHTHPSMGLCGGIALCFIRTFNRRRRGMPLLLRAAVCALFITALEYVTGLVVNRTLHLSVWDYSDMPLNLHGQICIGFSLLWFALCLPFCALLGGLTNKVRK